MDNAIGRVASILCLPYGYTVSLWCAGALVVRRHGLPSTGEVFLFAAGGVTGFLLLATLGWSRLDVEVPMRVPAIVVANAYPILAVLAVVVLLLAFTGRGIGFFGASFVATTIYVLSLAAVIRLVRDRPG